MLKVETLLEKVKSAIADYNMLSDGEEVFVGLSGGADSVALVLSLLDLGYDVKAIHVNHNLRGAESDGDEAFCRDLCSSLGIELKVFSVDVAQYSKEHSLGCEESARILRYDCLSRHANGKKIATAHNLDDNLETVILNLARGTGLKGLCGIPSVRDNIIRPLIYVSRSEIEQYLAHKKQRFVTDSTNLCRDFTRNKIRADIVPILKQINPNVLNNTLNLKNTLECENDYIAQQASEVFETHFAEGKLRNAEKLPKAILRRCIIMLLNQYDIPSSFERVCKIEDMVLHKNCRCITLSGDFELICRKGEVFIHEKTREFNDFCVDLKIGSNNFLSKKTVDASLLSEDCGDKINILFAKDCIDYDKIKGQLYLRCRRKGDKIKLKNRDFTSSVKQLLNAKIPREERDGLCFVCDDEGLIYIEKIGVADRVKVEESTKRILKITAY